MILKTLANYHYPLPLEMTMTNTNLGCNLYELKFSKEQYERLEALIDDATDDERCALHGRIWEVAREFARSLPPVTDEDGEIVEEDTIEWDDWTEAISNRIGVEITINK